LAANSGDGLAYSAYDNRGLIGGQKADNLTVTGYRALASAAIHNAKQGGW
jgi:hypothetical protein